MEVWLPFGKFARSTRVMAAILAVVGPLWVASGSYWALDRYRDPDERMADENAGRVFNGRVTNQGVVQAMNTFMRVSQPEVVLLGPSYANTDVRRDLMAEMLGVPIEKVAMLSIPNSVGAHWYATLKYRVFEPGYRPKLVVVVSGMQSMLLNTPLTESSWTNLQTQVGSRQDALIDEKARGNTALTLARYREQRGKIREGVVGLLRDVPTRIVLQPFRPHRPVSTVEIRGSLDRVFADERVDMGLHTHAAMPVAVDHEIRGYDPEMLPAPVDSFVPHITRLASDHGARIVWVRPPMSPEITREMDDVVPRGTQRAMVAMLQEMGGDFLDMRRLPMSSDMFKNIDHMNAEGSTRFTRALGRALNEIDALQPEAIPDAIPPLEAASIEVLDAPGQIPPAEAAWKGTGMWVGPGASLRVRFDEGWDARRGVFVVELLAEQLGREGATPSWTVVGKPVPVSASDVSAGWRIWRARRVLTAPTGPFEVRFEVPSDGAWVRVSGLSLGRRAGRSLIVGDDATVDGASARLFGVFELIEGAVVDHTIHPDFLNEPGPVPSATREVIDVPLSRVARFDTPKWDFLSDEHLRGQSHFGSRCSPLRVTDDEVLLPFPNVSCVEVQRTGEGRTCHTPEAIFFTAADGTDPASNGRSYKMVLDEGRRCDGAVWLYPKDHFRVRWPPQQLAGFRRGATHFTFDARYLQKRKAMLHLTLRVDGKVRVDASVDGRELWEGAKVWELDPPILPGHHEVELEVKNEDFVFYLIEEAALSEGALRVPSRRWVVGTGLE